MAKNSNFDKLLKSASKALGRDSGDIEKSVQSGDISNLLSGMSSEDAQKIQSVLSDKEATQKILATPEAQDLLNKLMGKS